MSNRPRWETAADVALTACGPVWLLGIGADEPPGDVAALAAAWVFLIVAAPWAVVRITRSHRHWLHNGRSFAQAPRTLVLAACLATSLVLAGLTIGGPIGGAVVNIAGLALLAFGVLAALVAFTPLGGVLFARARQRGTPPRDSRA